MRKLSLTLTTLVCFFIFGRAVAQKEVITSASATSKHGYSILNKTGAITIYKYQHKAHSPKETEKYLPTYFFTTASADELKPLSKANIKKAFPENHAFHDALDASLQTDADLISYDAFHKMYKLNWILKQHS